MPSENGQFLEFDVFRLDVKTPALWLNGELVPVAPKAIEVLVLLVEKRGEIVTREELLTEIWHETYVEEANITYTISLLRKALGDKRLIQTVPKRGYRFNAEVVVAVESPHEAETSSHQASRPRRFSRWGVALLCCALVLIATIGYLNWPGAMAQQSRESRPAIRSLAILPFRETEKPGEDSIGAGLTDTLITRIGSLRRFTVRPFSTVARFKKSDKDAIAIARELKCDAVLTGSLESSDGRLRLKASLTDARDGGQIWKGTIDEESGDILTLQNKLAEQIAGSLIEQVTEYDKKTIGREFTTNNEAFRAYLRGRTIFERRVENGFQQVLDEYQRAISIDPTFALAYSGIADLFARKGNGSNGAESEEAYRKAKAFAQKAIELDDTLAEGFVSLARLRRNADWDLPAAEREFKRALEIDPDHVMGLAWYAQMLSSVGRHDEALAMIRRAIELDPVSPAVNGVLFPILEGRGDFQEGLRLSREAYEFDKENANAKRSYATFLFHHGEYEKVLEVVEESRSRDRMMPHVALPLLVTANYRLGRTELAQEFLAELSKDAEQNPKSLYSLAINYAELGLPDDAIQALEKCFELREERLLWMNTEPRFGTLRTNPRFIKIARRVGVLS